MNCFALIRRTSGAIFGTKSILRYWKKGRARDQWIRDFRNPQHEKPRIRTISGLERPCRSGVLDVFLPRELYSPMSHIMEHFAFDDVTFPLR